ncbi:uncharacterized protein LOC125771495 [Anopheles funestus]|uniref:uncharacterized protein LOC125771495 n=1 Tax=Anopheles funestus TaxID=62324 RepID=UPI0020C6754E|nr:uncharacterized protein LOC125771495 [Anopheles funestus]
MLVPQEPFRAETLSLPGNWTTTHGSANIGRLSRTKTAPHHHPIGIHVLCRGFLEGFIGWYGNVYFKVCSKVFPPPNLKAVGIFRPACARVAEWLMLVSFANCAVTTLAKMKISSTLRSKGKKLCKTIQLTARDSPDSKTR